MVPVVLAAAVLREVPPGAAVELSDGTRRSVAQLLSEHWAARAPPPDAGGAGAWCCVPVWNGRSGEVWSAVVASDIELATDPLCKGAAAARVCPRGPGFPVERAAFVNLCPGSAGCGTAAAAAAAIGAPSEAAAGELNGTAIPGSPPAPQMSPPIVLSVPAEKPSTPALNGTQPQTQSAPAAAPADAPPQPQPQPGNATTQPARSANATRPARLKDRIDVVVLPGSSSGARVQPPGGPGPWAAAAIAAVCLALL
jgi:hypothetical protein